MKGNLGNLKDYVLSGRQGDSCEKGALVTFLSQVASALDYLHTKHIVHGNLRAEHVSVESSLQVRSSLFVKAFYSESYCRKTVNMLWFSFILGSNFLFFFFGYCNVC